jgi:LysR family transcriptional regulator for bpeEF and oprC
MNQIRAMRVFLRVAELGSLTAASADLGYSRGMASSILNELEAYLGVRLVERTTRATRLTAEGAHYADRARDILAQIEALEDEVGGSEKEPVGHLRVQIPPGLLRVVLAAELPDFFRRYSGITLEILSRNALPDFMADRLDAAVFVGDMPDSSLVSRRLSLMPLITVAAPGYLARNATPATPDDLTGHALISLISSRTGLPIRWRYGRGAAAVELSPAPRLAVESADTAIAAAVGGIGIMQVTSYLVWSHVREGRLVPILDDWRPASAEARLVMPPGRHRPKKLKAFEDFLVEAGRRFRKKWRITDVT